MSLTTQASKNVPAPFHVVPLAEFLRHPRKPRDFGGWRLDRRLPCVYYIDPQGRELYWIGLDRCRTSAQVLDWIAQISYKAWATSATIAGLVRILDDLIHFQASLCSCGHERGPIDAAAMVRSGRR